MGASSSREPPVSPEQREMEAVAASAGALPTLQKAFSNLSDPQTNSVPLKNLEKCFGLSYSKLVKEAPKMPDFFPELLDHLGESIAEQFLMTGKGELSWIEFVRGYNKCCGRMSGSMLLSNLLRVYTSAMRKVNAPSNLEFESEDPDCKISGFLLPIDAFMLLWMCWTMSWHSRSLKVNKGKAFLCLPDVNHLVLSVITSCGNLNSGFDVWTSDVSSLEVQIPAGKFVTWVLMTVPHLPDCFVQFVRANLECSETSRDEMTSSSVDDNLSATACDSSILTHGRAWAVTLSLRSSMSEEIQRACFPRVDGGMDANLLYRSSIHGRGVNRFWSCIEGYKGPLLILVAASSGNANEGSSTLRKRIIGALTHQGLENRDTFYGSSGCLYAMDPVFHAFSSTGKGKNFVYSHLHATGRGYDPHPKPVGIAFGGNFGNERIFIDEDFGKVTIRHHASDKTYQPGSLFPDQGFLPLEALISEVEVWGLGGKVAKEGQNNYKKREEIFTEQRRKVDLKTFANWEDSPEKLMMDMMSDPNTVRREDR